MEKSRGSSSFILFLITLGDYTNLLPLLFLQHMISGLCSGNENITVYACDCSNEALEMARDMINANCGVSVKQRFYPFYCDFSETGLPKWLSCYSCCGTHKQKRQSCSLGSKYNPTFSFLFLLYG